MTERMLQIGEVAERVGLSLRSRWPSFSPPTTRSLDHAEAFARQLQRENTRART